MPIRHFQPEALKVPVNKVDSSRKFQGRQAINEKANQWRSLP